jgi:hypothetical protein
MAASGAYYAGSRGRVRIASNVNVAGITKWSIRREVGEIEVSNFESVTDANGVIEGEFISDNISNSLVDIEGFLDFTTAATLGAFAVGATVALDLLYAKGAGATNAGFLDVSAFVKSISPAVELKQGQKFTASFRVFNAFPALVTTGT